VILLARAHVPESRAEATGPIDWRGGALAVTASALLTLGLTALSDQRGSGIAAALVAAGIVATAGFLRAERAAAAPLVPLGLFASRAFSGANLMTLFLYGALAGVLFLLPFELIGRRGMAAREVGLVLMPMGLIIGVFARPAGTLADRLGVRPLLVAGSALAAVAALWFAVAPAGLVAGALLPVTLLAAGMALVVAPLTTAVMNAAPDALAGAASGISNAASRLAGLFAVAGVSALAALVFRAAGAPPEASFGIFPEPAASDAASVAAAFSHAWRAGMLACSLMAALAALIAWITLGAEPAGGQDAEYSRRGP
jgi:predicted MFS family arabinose efflux permease